MQQGNGENGGNSGDTPPSSALKADAAVFIPRAPIPRAQPIEHQQPPPPTETYSGISHGTPQDRVKSVVELLTGNPPKYDEVIEPLTASLRRCLSNEKQLHDIVDIIFSKARDDNQFRYTGARMCNHLAHHLGIDKSLGNLQEIFRSNLLKRCQAEHSQRKELLGNESTHLQLIGYSLLMGELLLNLQHSVNEKPTPMRFLMTPIRELLMLLLDRPGSEQCLKCALQLSKMTAGILEDDEKADTEGTSPKMDAYFEKIDSILKNEQGTLTRKSNNYLTYLGQLRAKDWGRNVELATNGTTGMQPFVAEDGTFFYGQVGADKAARAAQAHHPPAPAHIQSAPDPTPQPEAHSQGPPPAQGSRFLAYMQQQPGGPGQDHAYSGIPVEAMQQMSLQQGYGSPAAVQQGQYGQQFLPAHMVQQQQQQQPAYNISPQQQQQEMLYYQQQQEQNQYNQNQYYPGEEGDGAYPVYAQDEEFTDEISEAFEQFMSGNQQR